MGEGLGEIPDQTAMGHVVLFGEQSDLIAQPEQIFVEALGLDSTPDKGKVVHQPEAAGEEGAFTTHQAVGGTLVVGAVAAYKALFAQFVLHSIERESDSSVVRWEETHEREEEQARVEVGGVEGADEAPAPDGILRSRAASRARAR